MGAGLTTQQALLAWRTALVNSVRGDGPDLSSRQMALLLSVYMISDQHTVRGLAATLQISKPAISRAVDALCGLGFLRRAPDPRDGRSVLVQRTVKGSVFLSKFADSVANSIAAVNEPQE